MPQAIDLSKPRKWADLPPERTNVRVQVECVMRITFDMGDGLPATLEEQVFAGVGALNLGEQGDGEMGLQRECAAMVARWKRELGAGWNERAGTLVSVLRRRGALAWVMQGIVHDGATDD